MQNPGFPEPQLGNMGTRKDQTLNDWQFQLDKYKQSLTIPAGNYYPLIIRSVRNYEN